MTPRTLPAATLMRAAQDAPDRPYPRGLGVRQRFALARLRDAGGAWLDTYPHEGQALAALERRGLIERDAGGRVRLAGADTGEG